MDAVVSVSVSVLAETESFIRFLYRFWRKRKIAISACFGFGRNEKKPFGRTLSTNPKTMKSDLSAIISQHSTMYKCEKTTLISGS